MEKGKVSVVIPYNKDRGFLKDATLSVEAQTYDNIELILSKGDSTVGVNFNNGVKKATGEFIKGLAEDDLLTPNAIYDLVNGIGDADFITANAYNFQGINTEPIAGYLGGVRTLSEMLERNCIHGGSVMYRKSSFEKYGYRDEELVTAEEYDMHLSWLKQGAKQAYVNKYVYKYRLWNGSKSQHLTSDPDRKKYIEWIKDRYQ